MRLPPIGLAVFTASFLLLTGCAHEAGAPARAAVAAEVERGKEAPAGHGHAAPTAKQARARAVQMLARMLADNDAYAKNHAASYFARFRTDQHPMATVVACSDSRFHMHVLDKTPDDELFVVRNIGNQLDATSGSVEYGVRHLHTPLLVVVGHVGCGAVEAAMGDYQAYSPLLRRELDALHLSIFKTKAQGSHDQRWLSNVVGNVHLQASYALAEYADLVAAGKLFVVGLVYDFRDDLGHGYGRIHIVNVNGERRAPALAALPLLVEAARARRAAGH